MGFGIGGDYPLSATIMAEYSSTKWRGSFLAAVFAMQARACRPMLCHQSNNVNEITTIYACMQSGIFSDVNESLAYTRAQPPNTSQCVTLIMDNLPLIQTKYTVFTA